MIKIRVFNNQYIRDENINTNINNIIINQSVDEKNSEIEDLEIIEKANIIYCVNSRTNRHLQYGFDNRTDKLECNFMNIYPTVRTMITTTFTINNGKWREIPEYIENLIVYNNTTQYIIRDLKNNKTEFNFIIFEDDKNKYKILDNLIINKNYKAKNIFNQTLLYWICRLNYDNINYNNNIYTEIIDKIIEETEIEDLFYKDELSLLSNAMNNEMKYVVIKIVDKMPDEMINKNNILIELYNWLYKDIIIYLIENRNIYTNKLLINIIKHNDYNISKGNYRENAIFYCNKCLENLKDDEMTYDILNNIKSIARDYNHKFIIEEINKKLKN